MEIIIRFFSDESGSNALEHGLIVALISLPIVTGAANAATVLVNMFVALNIRVGAIAALSP